ncbi:Metallophosphoesterase domain [Penicillium roqueforti FM164]|uniref:Metallophosphoesterase domain n=1 Tax=Penicillium roqueforti (strain FM164) TaxID=1365484 RepID=W6Q518_PENRF|nr:Metallophosphoesterase domain [Penicillium roqueforti FM164]
MSSLHELLHRQRPGRWQEFRARPCVFLAKMLYGWYEPIPATPLTKPIAVVCISDTHNTQTDVHDGDILIHAGDLTQSGSFQELQDSITWLRSLPHPTKIVIAGNHDLLLDSARDDVSGRAASERAQIDWGDIIYLENEEVTIYCPNGRQLRVYGSPYSCRHGNWAFQYPRNQDVWAGSVPDGIDVLITHGPPLAHLDLLKYGCSYLLQTLWRIRPRLHVFGHIHEGSGTELMLFDRLQEAYEGTVAAGGGLKNLLFTAWEFAKEVLRPAVEAKCLLVNPAIVGGLRDNERRLPIKVFI